MAAASCVGTRTAADLCITLQNYIKKVWCAPTCVPIWKTSLCSWRIRVGFVMIMALVLATGTAVGVPTFAVAVATALLVSDVFNAYLPGAETPPSKLVLVRARV